MNNPCMEIVVFNDWAEVPVGSYSGQAMDEVHRPLPDGTVIMKRAILPDHLMFDPSSPVIGQVKRTVETFVFKSVIFQDAYGSSIKIWQRIS